jgi:hypothetical protein
MQASFARFAPTGVSARQAESLRHLDNQSPNGQI